MATADDLAALISSDPRQVVFLVGSGISTAIPTTGQVKKQLLAQVTENPALATLRLADIDLRSLGFEMTLNDLRGDCPVAVESVLHSLRCFDEQAQPSRAHVALAMFLRRGGVVLTTNYDRLIERGQTFRVRFDRRADDDAGFRSWRADLEEGSTLFKLHGSFDRLGTCLAALEDVGTEITDARADMLAEVVRKKVMCIVGWSGSDPDIPAVFQRALNDRPRDLPIYWVLRTERSVRNLGSSMIGVAERWPVYSDGSALLSRVIGVNGSLVRSEPPIALEVDLRACSRSGLDRFAGQLMRRLGKERLALIAFRAAFSSAINEGERMAATEERALTMWGAARGRPSAFRKRAIPSRTASSSVA